MKKRPGLGQKVFMVAVVCWGHLVEDVSSQETLSRAAQVALARDLRSTSAKQVMEAVNRLYDVPVEEWDGGLRKALADAVLDEVMRPDDQKVLDDIHQFIAMSDLALDIAFKGDPVVIPTLIRFPPRLRVVIAALYELGEPAFRAVLDMMSSASPVDFADHRTQGVTRVMYSEGLEVLAAFVHYDGVDAFDRETQAELRAITIRTLESPTKGYSLDAGMRLALALGDPEALAAVEALTDRNTIRARGITGSRQINWIERDAKDAVAGRMPVPCCRLPTPYQRPGTLSGTAQMAVARELRGTSAKQVMAAVDRLYDVPVEEWDGSVRQALVDAVLDEMMRTVDQKVLTGDEQFFTMSGLALDIAFEGDQVVIPALILFPEEGSGITAALYELGEPAFRAVLHMMSSASPVHFADHRTQGVTQDMYSAGLDVLAAFVHYDGMDAFDRETQAELRALALRTLESATKWFPLGAGMRLALALGDPEALAAVEALTDRNTIRARGVTDRRQIDWIERDAKDAMAGRMAVPCCGLPTPYRRPSTRPGPAEGQIMPWRSRIPSRDSGGQIQQPQDERDSST